MTTLEPRSAASAAAFAAFGFGMALVSSTGQTFFLGLFGRDVQAELEIDEARWGLIYGLATLCSGALMFRAGAQADRRPVRCVLAASLALLGGGAAILASAGGAAALFVALFLLRFGGQGLAGHLAMVVAARAPVRRGRCLAVAGLGFVAGEATLPVAVVTALGLWGWRGVWWGILGALAVVALPSLWRLSPRDRPPADASPSRGEPRSPGLDRRALIRSPSFLAALSVLLVPPFAVTACFAQQSSIVEQRGWTPALFAVGFFGFAASQALTNWITGSLVDRFGSRSLFRYYLVPLAVGLAALGWVPGLLGLWTFFLGLGMTSGAQTVISAALWVELFGLRQLGLVRGVYFGFMVLSTAAAPILLGAGLAADLPLAGLAGGVAAYGVSAPWIAARGLSSR